MPRWAAMWFVVTSAPFSPLSSSRAASRMRSTVPPARAPRPLGRPLDTLPARRVFALDTRVITLTRGGRDVHYQSLRRPGPPGVGGPPALRQLLLLGLRRWS